jgi:hypothetical protein
LTGSYFLSAWFRNVIRFWRLRFRIRFFVDLLGFIFGVVHVAGLGGLEFLLDRKAVAVSVDVGIRTATSSENVGDSVFGDGLGFTLESL